MAIFPRLVLERVVQTDDATRLDARQTFISKGEAAITLVEIEPEAGAGFVDVTGTSSQNWFLDWQYSGLSRSVDVSVRVTTDGVPVTYTDSLEVLTPEDDYLFSDDQDLVDKEEEILKFLPEHRKSYLNVHRKAQEIIVERFNEDGVTDVDGNKLTKADFVDIDEVRQWSRDLTLHLIYQDLSNVVGDVFSLKSDFYWTSAESHQKRAFYRVDRNNDGSIGTTEGAPIQTKDLIRT